MCQFILCSRYPYLKFWTNYLRLHEISELNFIRDQCSWKYTEKWAIYLLQISFTENISTMSKIIRKTLKGPRKKNLMHPNQKIWCDATLNLCDVIKLTLRMGIYGDVPQAQVPCGDAVIPLGSILQEMWSSCVANWANFDIVGYTSEICLAENLIWLGMIFVKSTISPGFDFEPSMPHVRLRIHAGFCYNGFANLWF